MGEYYLRHTKLKYIFDARTTIFLSTMGLNTVNDLLKCEFIKLMKHKEILAVWDELTVTVLKVRAVEVTRSEFDREVHT